MSSKNYYLTPTLQIDEVYWKRPVCVSGTNESFTDNTTPVDWFETE